MEWVEITARTVEEARDLALDQLGVDEQDAEVEVLEEPRAGLFGRLRGQARVRARVRPTAPRPKVERRERRRRRGESRGSGDSPKRDGGAGRSAAAPAETARRAAATGTHRPAAGAVGAAAAANLGDHQEQEGTAMSELTIDEQAEVVASFLRGLADQFGVDGTRRRSSGSRRTPSRSGSTATTSAC